MKKLALCLILCIACAGCAQPPPYIHRSGRKPVNELKHYPYLTEAERAKYKKLRDKELQPPANPLDLPDDPDALYGPPSEYDKR